MRREFGWDLGFNLGIGFGFGMGGEFQVWTLWTARGGYIEKLKDGMS